MLSISTWAIEPKALPDRPPQFKEMESSVESNNSSQSKKEKRGFSWKVGLSVYKDLIKTESAFFSIQVPVLAELYFPVVSSFEWVLQAGAGFRLKMEKREFCNPELIPDPPSGALADREFWQKQYKEDLERSTNKATCFKKKEKEYWYTPYFIGRTGFKYGSDIYAVLQGGATFVY